MDIGTGNVSNWGFADDESGTRDIRGACFAIKEVLVAESKKRVLTGAKRVIPHEYVSWVDLQSIDSNAPTWREYDENVDMYSLKALGDLVLPVKVSNENLKRDFRWFDKDGVPKHFHLNWQVQRVAENTVFIVQEEQFQPATLGEVGYKITNDARHQDII